MDKKHIVVIGASSGIGAACAVHFSKSCYVTGISRSGKIPEGVSSENYYSQLSNAASLDDLKESISSSVNKFGKISTIIVSAGLQNIKPVRAFKEAETLQLLTTNIAIPYFTATVFASQKFTQSDAVLCLMSSISAKRPENGIVLYGATKSATESLVAGLAKELAPRRVVGVSPGWLDTPMTQQFPHIYTKDFIQHLNEKTPLGGICEQDVVNTIEFLSSPSASKITGQVLVVDGGASL